MTPPDAACYPASMAPIATVVAWMSAVIPIPIRTIAIAISVMRIPVSVVIVGVTPRADVDINLCRCVSRRKHR
jgi:hypothetical protein